jgi:hypothetical protein
VRTGVPTTISVGRRLLLLALILAAEVAVLEAGLRWHGGSEGSPAFQALFMTDAAVGYRLTPNARTRYTTAEFSTDLAINPQGVRDDAPIGPKAAGERRVLILGDSLVLAVQVPLADTFGKRLEARLNAQPGAPVRWRVINGGVQGYSPVHEWLFFDRVAAAFEPDVVLQVVFVGNDAVEANAFESWLIAGRPVGTSAPALSAARRFLRSSLVWQMARVRWDQLRSRFTTATPEPPLATYLETPPPHVEHGLGVTRQAVQRIADRAAGLGARSALVLMPARFQVEDGDYGRLAAFVRQAGATLVRQAGTERFARTLAPLGLPTLDLLPVLEREPNRIDLFFQRNVHLTPRGHDVVAGALFEFLQASGLSGTSR